MLAALPDEVDTTAMAMDGKSLLCMPVKANQKSFLDDIRTLFKPLTTGESSIQTDQSTQKYTRCSLCTSGGLSRNS